MNYKQFKELCYNDFWIIPKWALFYALAIFTAFAINYDIGEVTTIW